MAHFPRIAEGAEPHRRRLRTRPAAESRSSEMQQPDDQLQLAVAAAAALPRIESVNLSSRLLFRSLGRGVSGAVDPVPDKRAREAGDVEQAVHEEEPGGVKRGVFELPRDGLGA